MKTKKPNKTGKLIFQTVKEGSHINVPFFGSPFYVHNNYTLECVHARSKRTHKNSGLKVRMFSLFVGQVYIGELVVGRVKLKIITLSTPPNFLQIIDLPSKSYIFVSFYKIHFIYSQTFWGTTQVQQKNQDCEFVTAKSWDVLLKFMSNGSNSFLMLMSKMLAMVHHGERYVYSYL